MLWWQIFILLVTFLSYFILCPQALSKHLSTEWPTMFILQFHFASWYKTLFKNHSHVPYRLFNPLTANYNRNLAICNCETTDQENIGCSFRNQTMLSKPLSLISNMEVSLRCPSISHTRPRHWGALFCAFYPISPGTNKLKSNI